MNPKSERLNKVIARHGLGSRRAVDAMIESGRVTVNGAPATLGQRVGTSDIIIVDGKHLSAQPDTARIVLAFNKPAGVTTTRHDPFAKVTVMNYLPKEYQHLYPVGRLDRDSRGLLLLTNDGDLAHHLMHPRFEHEKEYNAIVTPLQSKTEEQFKHDITRLAKVIVDPAAQTRPPRILQSQYDKKTHQGHITLVLKEGKKRQIRKLFQALGYLVTDLQRTRIGRVRLDRLREGEYSSIDPNLLR